MEKCSVGDYGETDILLNRLLELQLLSQYYFSLYYALPIYHVEQCAKRRRCSVFRCFEHLKNLSIV